MIETANLWLVPVGEDHAPLLFGALRDPQLYALMPEEAPKTLLGLRKRYAFLQRRKSPDGNEHWLNWTIFVRQTGEPAGTFQATVRDDGPSDIAYVMFKRHWRQGIASEAGTVVIDHIFERYPTPVIAANMDTRNIASIKLVERLGLTRTAFIPDADTFNGMSSDEYRYELTRAAWEARARQAA
jgi:RimJ/RimL family protein N-acetyltransferase